MTTTTRIGILAVRRSSLIKATPEPVWQEFETFERTGPNAADDHAGFEGGWDNHHLEGLRRAIEG